LTSRYKFLFVGFFLLIGICAQATGIRGNIKDEANAPLPYTSIFVKQTGSGSTSNVNGDYEITLPPGRYELVYQYLGYQTEVRIIDVKTDFEVVNITMKVQTTILQTFIVDGNNEDPAYTIMRKAIAKAKYHTQQLDGYSGRVYIKGVGKLKDYPWLAKKALEKEGIKKNSVFVTESVSEIKYTRPNKVEEK